VSTGGSSSEGKLGRDVKLTTQLHLVPIHLHDASAGTFFYLLLQLYLGFKSVL